MHPPCFCSEPCVVVVWCGEIVSSSAALLRTEESCFCCISVKCSISATVCQVYKTRIWRIIFPRLQLQHWRNDVSPIWIRVIIRYFSDNINMWCSTIMTAELTTTAYSQQTRRNTVERFLVLLVVPSLKKYTSYTNCFVRIHLCSIKKVDLLQSYEYLLWRTTSRVFKAIHATCADLLSNHLCASEIDSHCHSFYVFIDGMRLMLMLLAFDYPCWLYQKVHNRNVLEWPRFRDHSPKNESVIAFLGIIK